MNRLKPIISAILLISSVSLFMSCSTNEEEEEEIEMIEEEGKASYYARMFEGKSTASGETFENQELTAAHRTLPFDTEVEVTYPETGKTVTVRINDRGPYRRGRIIDLSRAAARELGMLDLPALSMSFFVIPKLWKNWMRKKKVIEIFF